MGFERSLISVPHSEAQVATDFMEDQKKAAQERIGDHFCAS